MGPVNESLSSNLTYESMDEIENTVASIILGLTYLVGVPGNLLVIWVIVWQIKQRSPTAVLILNLAVADSTVLITLPLWIYAISNGWIFGEALCKILLFLIYCNLYGSVFFITLMSVDRFMAVIYPFASQKWRNSAFVAKVLAVVWALTILFALPALFNDKIEVTEGHFKCVLHLYESKTLEIICLGMETLVGFAIPFTVLTICYICVGKRVKQMTHKKKNQTSMLIARIVIAFVVCWFPYHLFNLLGITATLIDSTEVSMRLRHISDTGGYLSGALAFISSSINPLLYAFTARSFRQGLLSSNLAKMFEQMIENTKEQSTKEDINMLRKEGDSHANGLQSQSHM